MTDRWFRMCQDVWGRLHGSNEKQTQDGKTFTQSWNAAEIMEMYSWKEEILMRKVKEGFTIFYQDKFFNGITQRDVWLQLVMWDRHGMTWNDAQSRWVKA